MRTLFVLFAALTVGGCDARPTARSPVPPTEPEPEPVPEPEPEPLPEPEPAAPCPAGETRPCALAPPCAAGVQTCDGVEWQACTPTPAADVCNGVDDDCNGAVDDGGINECGGSCPLLSLPGETCGTRRACERGVFSCFDANRVACELLLGGEPLDAWTVGGAGREALRAAAPAGDRGALIAGTSRSTDLVPGAEPPFSFVAELRWDGSTRFLAVATGGDFGRVVATPDGGAVALLGAGPDLLLGGVAITTEPGGILVRLAADGSLVWSRPLLVRGSQAADVSLAHTAGGTIIAAVRLQSWQRMVFLPGTPLEVEVEDPAPATWLIGVDGAGQPTWLRRVAELERGGIAARTGSGILLWGHLPTAGTLELPARGGATQIVHGEQTALVATLDDEGLLTATPWLGKGFAAQSVAITPDGGAVLYGGQAGTTTDIGIDLPPAGAVSPQWIVRLDANLASTWAHGIEGNIQSHPSPSLAAGTRGVLFAGSARGPIVFGPGDPEETVLDEGSGHAVVLAMFHPEGPVAWAHPVGGNEVYWVDAFTQADGNLVLLGWGRSPIRLVSCAGDLSLATREFDVFMIRVRP